MDTRNRDKYQGNIALKGMMNNSEVKTSKKYAELRDHIWNLVKDEAMQTTRGE